MTDPDERALIAAATPGPWERLGNFDVVHASGDVCDTLEYADAAFIAHFNPARVEGMLNEIDHLDGLLEQTIAECDALRSQLAAPERERDGLLPAESLALTVALAQVLRGEQPEPNTMAVCVYALARIDGRYDWTAGAADESPEPSPVGEPKGGE